MSDSYQRPAPPCTVRVVIKGVQQARRTRQKEGREKCQDCRPAPLPLTPRPCEAAGEATGAKARALRCPSHYRTGKDRGMLWSTKDSERFAGPRLSPPRGEVLGGSLTRM